MLVDVDKAEGREPGRLIGWHVVEIGMRQAWPFLTLADPDSGREVRLYADSQIGVLPDWPVLVQDDAGVLLALASVSGATVTGAQVMGGAIVLAFGEVTVRVGGRATT